MSAPAPCDFQRRVDDHFERVISPGEERSLREHLPGCERCRAYYERRMLLARLDPSAPSAADRLLGGLGLHRQRRWGNTMGWLGIAATAAIAGAVVFGHVSSPRLVDDGFAARGNGPARNNVQAFALLKGHISQPLQGHMSVSDELAFSYENPESKPYLMIFGVDEHRHVYWYYPSWTDPAQPPTSAPAEKSSGVHELPEAVRQAIDGRHLALHGVFLDAPISVLDVEKQVQAQPAEKWSLPVDGNRPVQVLEVKP
jgi:hypothetical protein